MADIWGQSGAPTWMGPEQREQILAGIGTELAQGFNQGFGMAYKQAGGSGIGAPSPRPSTVSALGGGGGGEDGMSGVPTGPEESMEGGGGAQPWDNNSLEYWAKYWNLQH